MKSFRSPLVFRPITIQLETLEEVEFLKEVLRRYIFKEHEFNDGLKDRGGIAMANQMRNFLIDE